MLLTASARYNRVVYSSLLSIICATAQVFVIFFDSTLPNLFDY